MIGYTWGKVKQTVSGWEKSHFGGFFRMIQDYPYIKLDYQIRIEPDASLTKELQWYTSEKLIKLYLLKVQKLGYIDALRTTTITVPNKYTKQEETFVITYLDDETIMVRVLRDNAELAPLFANYRKGILKSFLLKRIDENDDDEEGDTEPQDGDGSPKESKDSDKSAKSKEQQMREALAEMKKTLSDIKEHDPFGTKDSLSGYEGSPKFMRANVYSKEKEYKFSNSEIKDAENLLKLLDISFDPKSAEIKSLRAGKLDTLKIAEVAAGSTAIYKQTVEDQDTKPFGICILADLSGSMTTGNRLAMQKHTMNVLYLALSQIIPADKLWIYGHTGDDSPEIYPFHTPYETNYPLNIQNYGAISYQQNYDGPVIEAIHSKVRETCDDRIIFITLSDGQPSGCDYGGEKDITDMKRILERARRDEFVTVSIGMQYMSRTGLYLYNKTVDDLSNLARDVSQVVNKVVRLEFK
jgi:nitric oxide reductase activation protein